MLDQKLQKDHEKKVVILQESKEKLHNEVASLQNTNTIHQDTIAQLKFRLLLCKNLTPYFTWNSQRDSKVKVVEF
jgi:hypothetical protein